MGAEFWFGFAVGAFCCIGLLLIAALLASAGRADDMADEMRKSMMDHPAGIDYGSHMKVGPAIDVPLPPRDGIPPIREDS